ncbi:hypothetical protein GCM10022254_62980 [Actinomadura meridiana]|uniref:Uncharacterized protein n=1 Tax=Actinomadura meridiana TaxID=559626 RepID=A0ABP8CK48_9ACTN
MRFGGWCRVETGGGIRRGPTPVSEAPDAAGESGDGGRGWDAAACRAPWSVWSDAGPHLAVRAAGWWAPARERAEPCSGETKLERYRAAGILPFEEGGGPNGTLMYTDDRDGVDEPNGPSLHAR